MPVDGLSLTVAFGAGVLSFLLPCVLPLGLVYIVNLTGSASLTPEIDRRRTTIHAVSFVTGFTLVFAGLGASAGLLGAAIPTGVLFRIAGSVLVAFGVWLLAARRVPRLNYEMRLRGPVGRRSGYLRSLGLGAAFSLGWTPCVGPVLAGILTLASGSQTALQGSYLLLAYSLGLGVPFIAIGLAMGAAGPVLRGLNRHSDTVSTFSAVMLIAVGIMLLTGTLGRLIPLIS